MIGRLSSLPRTIAFLVVAMCEVMGSARGQNVAPLSREIGISLPDPNISKGYEEAARKNILAAVNPEVFFGYWSVCADGQGFGYGYTYPSLDGHQMTDALLWLGRVDIVKANWDYVRSFQRPDGSLPIAILPNLAGKQAGEGDHLAPVAANGGLYAHWVPGNPLQVLADPTYIQNADDIFRMTFDLKWLKAQLPSVNLSADHLASLVDDRGAVRGAGYYIERPARIEYDGVAQCHAVDAFRRAASLNRVAGDAERARKYGDLAERVKRSFTSRFWVKEKGRFAEYDNPVHGLISNHGLTDVDWAAVALDIATPDQVAVLWPKLKDEPGFYYGGMPTGIASRPETYEDWEFTHTDRHDLAAMGRVWYLDAQARARLGDAEGLLRGIRRVCEEGAKNGYYWRERYQPDGRGGVIAVGPNTYCEYPANLIRIVQRFLLGVNMDLDGSVVLAPTVTEDLWRRGFGQTLRWRDRALQYRLQSDRITGTYEGAGPQRLGVRLQPARPGANVSALADGLPLELTMEDGLVFVTLPKASPGRPCSFEIVRVPAKMGKLSPAPSPAIRFEDGAKSVRILVSLFDNIIYFPAKVNGTAELDFVLDTGASDVSALDQGVVEAKGLPRGRGTTGGGAGPEQVQMWELEGTTLSLPGMEIAGFRFITIPLKRMEPYWGRKKDGLLGGNILGRLVTRIDYDDRTVTFYDPGSFEAPGDGQFMPLTVEANTLFVTAKVKAEGSDVPVEGLFLLDTGVRTTFFNTPFTEKNRLIQKCSRTLENIAGFGIGGASRATMGRLASLQIGDFVVGRPVVQFNTATKGIEASRQFDGIIGADILSRFIVTLDYQNQRMMLRKGARFEQPFEYDMSGLYVVTTGDRNDVFKVENVVKDSPAAKAGLEKGDILVSVDHKPASSFTLETLKRHLREAGRMVALQIQRAGKTMDFSFSLERLI